MDYLPKDPAILVSSVNMLLRDEEFDTLESLCYAFSREPKEVKDYLYKRGFVWRITKRENSESRAELVRAMPSRERGRVILKDSIETAYSFLHQKRNVYIHSTLDWQKDDIELAIGSYVDDMSQELYEAISDGRTDFLRDHKRFGDDITLAVDRLEKLL